MNSKLKEENVFQTRKLNVTNISPRFSFKIERTGLPFRFVLQQNSEQSIRKVAATTCTNLNLIPNQLNSLKAGLGF